MKRRHALKYGAVGSLAALSTQVAANQAEPEGKLKILIAGGHPDDPETGCGGIAARYAEEGHEVILLYLTTGEAGIPGTSLNDAATIRKKEAEAACKILGARPIFAGQIDGATFTNNEWNEKFAKILTKEEPDMIFTHWPIDTHRDHRACQMLVYDAWLYTGRKQAFYYYEVVTGGQSMNFHPSHYVDITSVIQKKWDASFIHKSQKIKETWDQDHGKMEIFRGMEFGVKYAEALVHLQQSPLGYLPG